MTTARFSLLLLLAGCAHHQPAPPPPVVDATPRPPIAKREPHPQTLFGKVLVDDYFWLRAKDTPPVVEYLKAENAYTDAMTKSEKPFEDTLYKEMLGRVQETDVSVPVREDGYFYYARSVEHEQYPVLCRKSATGAAKDDRIGATASAPEEVLLDLNEIGRKEKFVGLGSTRVSPDGKILGYALDTTGFRQFTLRFKAVGGGAMKYEEAIPRVDAFEWALDNATVFYVSEDATTKRPNRLYRHRVGSDPRADVLVYEEKDEMFDLDVSRTRSRAYFLSSSESKTTTEVRFLPTNKPTGTWQVIAPREHDHQYFVDHRGKDFYIRTDSAPVKGDKAINFRLVTAPVASPGRAHWKEVIPHRADVMLENVDLFAHRIVLHERADALPRLRVLDDENASVDVPMPESVFSVMPDRNPDFETPSYRFHYQSFVTPDSVYDYDFSTHALALRKRQQVNGGYDPTQYEESRTFATAKDGTKIPISLVHKKGLVPDAKKPQPTLLYGYGSYGFSMPITFSSPRVSLLDRGVVYALAHIRGGGDLGKAWHRAGRMGTKMNTFTDFVACGEALIAQGWTSKDHLAIQGGSAGGLLMGAVTNLRPDLWKAVVAQVPFVDVLNTMLDESLPLTVGEFEEWGNPKEKASFEVMSSYSPYDNIAHKAYPAMLVLTSYNDSQVMYWEPAKFVARLRAEKTDSNPLLLKINMEPAGHGGQSGRYNALHEAAFTDAWILTELGITR